MDLDANGGIDGRYITTNTYDAGDHRLTSVYLRDVNGDGNLETRIAQAFTYDAAGRQATSTEDYDIDADGVVEQSSRSTSSYDAAGNLVRSVSRNDSDFFGSFFTYEVTTDYSYNQDRRRTNIIQSYDFLADGTVENRITEVNTYDSNGFPLTYENSTDNTAYGVTDWSFFVTFTNTPEGAQQSFLAEFDDDGDGVVDDTQSSQISYAPAANALTPIVTQYLGF